ncbi:C-myc promoter-binding protein-like [Tubulanus polymorphus]|uniref:C-myc promoter-binding protein-like n=1 Tax=Tubulanus polymorphus TaxID=672921 RepID=UPI003DA5A657
MDDKRVVDYFVVAGLPANPLPLEEFSNEAILKPTHKQDPITDVIVIIKNAGESPPKGFTCIEKTPTGYPSDLNHGSIRAPEMYLCYKRGRNKPPLTDIGVLYEGKERVMSGCEVVYVTPQGRPANVNNSNSQRIYITYRRANENAASDTLAVTEICIILANKGEMAPHAFCQINKNLNRGMVGSDVFLCYKKSMVKTNTIAYNPGCLGRYPLEDHADFPLPESVPLFCLPMGSTLECWPQQTQHPLPVFSTFILTGSSVEKVYGAAVTFYEEYEQDKLTDLQQRLLGLKEPKSSSKQHSVHVNKSICLLSHWPFFDEFKMFLSYLYRISIIGPHNVPMERHISHFMFSVPFPSPKRPRILVELNDEAICLNQPEETPLPKSGASFITLVQNLGPENCLDLLLYVILEHKILIHSLRPAVLTSVAEAVSTLIFPFHWQCPYIPLCPLGLSDVLNAPCPYIVGVDSQYFDLYDPPPDVTCVDLDTNTITPPEDKKTNYKLLPKKPLRILQNTLNRIYEQIFEQGSNASTPEVTLDTAPIDPHFRKKRRKLLLEMEIQEAFLRFMGCLLKGYKNYLLPITSAPTIGTTDASSLFDMQGFLRSRDKAYHKFFNMMMKTQIFIRFIEERSFVSDKDASLAFFDECAEKVDENSDEPKLIELDDSQKSEHTVLITPPEPVGLPPDVKYTYNGFPELNPDLFLHNGHKAPSTPMTKSGHNRNSPLASNARRTKQEIKSAQKIAQQHQGTPLLWAKCLLSHCYSLWFIHLPSYVKSMHSKTKALRTAFDVLQKMQESRLDPPDEVCYRVLMQLCGQYQQPVLAVKVLFEMKRNGIHPNAITYGFYNKAVLESKWPSSTSNAYLKWTKLRNVLLAVTQFRNALRRRSMSLYSNSESDPDRESRASLESFQEEFVPLPPDQSPQKGMTTFVQDLVSVDGVVHEDKSSSDQGYSSMTQVDVASKLSNSDIPHHEPIILEGVVTSESGTDQSSNRNDVQGVSTSPPKSGPSSHQKAVVRSQSEKLKSSDIDSTQRQKTAKNSAYSIGGKNIIRRATVGSFDPLDSVGADEFRTRVGSIVRHSVSSFGSSSSVGTLRGSTFGSAAGILISTSQVSLEGSSSGAGGGDVFDDAGLPDRVSGRSSRVNDERRRHKSEGSSRRHCQRGNQSAWRNRHVSSDQNPSLVCGDSERFVEDFGQDSKLVSSLSNSPRDDGSPRKNIEHVSPGAPPAWTPLILNVSSSKSVVVNVSTSERDEQKTPTHASDKVFDIPEMIPEKETVPATQRTPVTENDPLGLFTTDQEITPAPSRSESVVNANPLVKFDLDPCNLFSSTPGTSQSSIVLNHKRNDDVKKDLLIDFDPLDNDSAGVTRRADRPHELDVVNGNQPKNGRPKRAHTISESSTNSWLYGAFPVAPRQQTCSESSECSNQSDGEAWSPMSPIRSNQSLNEAMLTTSSPRNIGRNERGGFIRSESFSDAFKYAASAVSAVGKKFKRTISSTASGFSASSLPKAVENDNSSASAFGSGDRLTPKRRGSEAAVDYLHRSESFSMPLSAAATAAAAVDSGFKSSPQIPQRKMSFGSAPVPSKLDQYVQMQELQDLERSASAAMRQPVTTSMAQSLLDVAMEVDMWSCSRCHSCNSLLYDEEIMAGWSADDNNLNTTCQFCSSRLVPFLHVYVKDWRSRDRALFITPSYSLESMQSVQSLPLLEPSQHSNDRNLNTSAVVVSDVGSVSSTGVMNNAAADCSKSDTSSDTGSLNTPVDNLIDFSPIHNARGPMYTGTAGVAVSERRRCASECLPNNNNATTSSSSSGNNERRMNLNNSLKSSIEEETDSGERLSNSLKSSADCNSSKCRSFTDSTCTNSSKSRRQSLTSEPITVPYLSPLVLRKEVENILVQEGDSCIGKSEFIDEHPIIFWNLVWYFKRLSVPSHLPGYVLTLKSNDKEEQHSKDWSNADSRHVSIRTLWDSIRAHDEIGYPMYLNYNTKSHTSRTVSALVTDNRAFSKSIMQQIVSNIECNDLLSPIKLMMNERKRLSPAKGSHFRSIYREIIYLAFVACGRSNIDHDAFDREYRHAYHQMNFRDRNKLQHNDKPPSNGVVWCRKIFRELELLTQ